MQRLALGGSLARVRRRTRGRRVREASAKRIATSQGYRHLYTVGNSRPQLTAGKQDCSPSDLKQYQNRLVGSKKIRLAPQSDASLAKWRPERFLSTREDRRGAANLTHSLDVLVGREPESSRKYFCGLRTSGFR
jgi:hypothetical protein